MADFDRNELLEEAHRIRAGIEAVAAYAPDELAVTVPTLFPAWTTESHAYIVGDRVQYGGLLYRCLTAHTSQESWTPDAAPSLWVCVDDPAIEWPEWWQPAGSTDAYPVGAQVSHNGKRWTSNVDANVWEPGAAGITQWTEAAE